MSRLIELYIDVYSDLFFVINTKEYNVLFFVLKPHILARINVYKEELIERTWVPERIEYVIPSLDLKQWKY